MILGAEFFVEIIGQGLITGTDLVAQEAKIEWVMSGKLSFLNIMIDVFILTFRNREWFDGILPAIIIKGMDAFGLDVRNMYHVWLKMLSFQFNETSTYMNAKASDQIASLLFY